MMPASLLRGFPAILCALCMMVAAQGIGASAADAGESYRLSGIITLDGDRRIALVELPDGGFSVIRQGDDFDSGEVVEIAREWLLIRDAAGERRVWLAASGFRVQDDAPGTAGVVLDAAQTGHVLQRTLDTGQAIAEIDRLSDRKADKQARLDDLLGPLVGLPNEAEIVGINHRPLGSVQESMDTIRRALAQGEVVRLNIAGQVGKDVVYLLPDLGPGAGR